MIPGGVHVLGSLCPLLAGKVGSNEPCDNLSYSGRLASLSWCSVYLHLLVSSCSSPSSSARRLWRQAKVSSCEGRGSVALPYWLTGLLSVGPVVPQVANSGISWEIVSDRHHISFSSTSYLWDLSSEGSLSALLDSSSCWPRPPYHCSISSILLISSSVFLCKNLSVFIWIWSILLEMRSSTRSHRCHHRCQYL